jgi:hypothetical protein
MMGFPYPPDIWLEDDVDDTLGYSHLYKKGTAMTERATINAAAKDDAPPDFSCIAMDPLYANTVRKGANVVPVLLHRLLERKTYTGKDEQTASIVPIIREYLAPALEVDGYGNRFAVVYAKDEHGKDVDTLPDIMFTAHMDTVHSKSRGPLDTINLVEISGITDPKYAPEYNGMIMATDINHQNTRHSSVLGADDKVGIYVLISMANARIPGVYYFFKDEESGREGSTWLLKNKPEWLKKFKAVVSMDRKGYTDVITKQRGAVCCSDDFAEAISSQLNACSGIGVGVDYTYAPCPHGAYTDSATFTGVIPECTNISVGYFDQHSASERFDIIWLINAFIPAIKRVDWANLPIKRVIPVVTSPPTYTSPYTYTSASNVTNFPSDADPKSYNKHHNVHSPIAPGAITDWTPFNNLPIWDPAVQYPDTISKEKLERMVFKTLALGIYTNDVMAGIIAGYMTLTRDQNAALKTQGETMASVNEELNDSLDAQCVLEQEVDEWEKWFKSSWNAAMNEEDVMVYLPPDDGDTAMLEFNQAPEEAQKKMASHPLHQVVRFYDYVKNSLPQKISH